MLGRIESSLGLSLLSIGMHEILYRSRLVACYGCAGRIIFHRGVAEDVAAADSRPNTTNWDLCTIAALMPGPAGADGGRTGRAINGAWRVTSSQWTDGEWTAQRPPR